jgi:NAD(P)-dependent dehydrogenase (short-subunit alcohol dehydrogenase family)
MTDRVAIVTAASRGIGAACARALVRCDHRVALLARSDEVEDVASALDGVAVRGSVESVEDLQRLCDVAMSEYGRIDVVVANSGHPERGELLDLPDEAWHAGVDLMLLSVVRLCRIVVPIMQRHGGGAIVNVSTLGAEEPNLRFPISSALRGALAGFTKLFADRHARDGIRMNAVLPGFADNHPVDEDVLAATPMGRAVTVEEIAETVCFLASDAASGITGQSVRVDAGLGRSL